MGKISSEKAVEAALEGILDDLSSDNARRAYALDWTRFVDWLRERDVKPLEVTPKIVREHVNWMRDERKLARSTIGKAISVIREIYRRLVNDEAIEVNPARETKKPKMDGAIKAPHLDEEEIKKLLLAQPQGTWRERRDRLVLHVLFGLGWRRAEVAKITGAQIKARAVETKVKGNKTILVGMPKWLAAEISEWRRYAGTEEGPLFPWSQDDLDRPITHDIVYGIVIAAGRRAGFPEGAVTPHALRRAFITIARKRGVDLKKLQLSVGHASQATTERYDKAQDAAESAPGDVFEDLVQN